MSFNSIMDKMFLSSVLACNVRSCRLGQL